ncbi:MAG: transferrin receptor-like dimerization domain-containing protein [Chitinophagia bacterium]|jgi:N-acetylated-alpha-linked acidic dipeptidase
MKKHSLLSLMGILASSAMLSAQIAGFTSAAAAKQLQTENKFDANLSAKRIEENIRTLSARPHHLGSPGGKEVVQKLETLFKEWGWNTRVETYQVLFPTPITRKLEMLAPYNYKALLQEPALKEDRTSNQTGQLPTYNAWSADGDVTAALVFVNYGLPEDYEMLERMGVDVKGKIVIAKYGRSWRGIKPKVAQEHGAVGCIIYSDPKDDGYFQGDVYPKGAFKNEYGVQRGSIMDMVIYPGDPLTPNVGATEKAKRLDRLSAPNLLKIPVLPISYKDALPLLKELGGRVAPNSWRGALPITYHVGPGNTRVHLNVKFSWDLKPAQNVIATMPGQTYPDQWIIRGNHHDAWVNGAADPISGLSAMLEEARSIGLMVKAGWKPSRTLVYCAWDGEEPGLLGSTEWLEDHEKELRQKTVAYINTDGNERGYLSAQGSHALENFLSEISKEVKDPQTGVSVFERAKAKKVMDASGINEKAKVLGESVFQLEAMGSGSDYSSFIQHAGIPSLNIGYGGEGEGGEYHSIYDSYDLYRRFKDPTFNYGVALSQTAGRAVLRLSESNILPFDFRSLYKKIKTYVEDLQEKTDKMRLQTQQENSLIVTNQYRLTVNPENKLQDPAIKEEVPVIDFVPLTQSLAALDKSGSALWEYCQKSQDVNAESLATINKKLFTAEQELLTETGLPRRGWYKHTLYAPGFYTGYGVKTLPGVREAIEQRNWPEASAQIKELSKAIQRLADYLQGLVK